MRVHNLFVWSRVNISAQITNSMELFVRERIICFFYNFLILLGCWSDNSFISPESWERFCFYSNLGAFEQLSCFWALFIFSGNKVTTYPQRPKRAHTPNFWKAFSWYTMEYPTCHWYFLSIHTCLKVCVYTKKGEVTCGYLMVYQEQQSAWQCGSQRCVRTCIYDCMMLWYLSRYYTPFVWAFILAFAWSLTALVASGILGEGNNI